MPIMAILFSCSSNDENLSEQNSGKGIKFVTNVPSMSVRSGDIDNSNLSSFNVSAYRNGSIFEGIDKKTPTQSGSEWKLSPTVYWPGSETLIFWAYSPTTLNPTVASTGITMDYTPSNTVASQQDIVAAYATGTSTNSAVALQFKHLLSKIKFQVKSEALNGYTIKIKGVRLGWIKRGKGKLNFSSSGATWTDASDNGETSYSIGSESETAIELTDYSTAIGTRNFADITFDGGAMYIVPQNLDAWVGSSSQTHNAYISFLCQVSQYGTKTFPTSGDYAWGAAIGIDTDFVAGNQYTYQITFFPDGTGGCGYPDPAEDNTDPAQPIVPGGGGSSSEIKFSVSVDTWTPNTETPSYSN